MKLDLGNKVLVKIYKTLGRVTEKRINLRSKETDYLIAYEVGQGMKVDCQWFNERDLVRMTCEESYRKILEENRLTAKQRGGE